MEEEEAMQQPLTDSSLTTHSLTSDEEQLHSETLSLHSSARKMRLNNTFYFLCYILLIAVNTEEYCVHVADMQRSSTASELGQDESKVRASLC